MQLGWPEANEMGKFYDHAGTTSWYYYVYGSSEHIGTPTKNEAASLVCFQPVNGDVAVVRSGPADADYEENIVKEDLVNAVEFHKTHDRGKVFLGREESRFRSNVGV